MSYAITTEGAIPYSITTLRSHTRIKSNDFDSELRRSWFAAIADIEKRTGLLLRPCTIRGTILGSPDGWVFPTGPVDVSTVTITNTEDSSVLTQGRTGDYLVDDDLVNPRICVVNESSFTNRVKYQIDFNAGFASIPDDIEIAALELAAHHFENREMSSPFPTYQVPSSVWSILANYGTAKI